MGLGWALAFASWYTLQRHEDAQLEAEVAALGQQHIRRIDALLVSEQRALRRMAVRWVEGCYPSQEAWEADAHAYIEDFPVFQAVEWVDPQHRVQWVVPIKGNEAAVGLDLSFEPHRKLALEAAKSKGKPTVSAPVDLVQGGKGFLVYVPIHREDRFEGFILGVYRTSELFDFVFQGQSEVSATVSYKGTPIYQTGPESESPARWVGQLEGGWDVRFALTPEGHHKRRTRIPLVLGLLAALAGTLAGASSWSLFRVRQQAELQENTNRDLVAQSEALQRAQNAYRLLVYHLPDTSVFLFDDSFRHLVAEGAVLDHVGVPARSGDLTLWEVFPRDIAQELHPHYYRIFKGSEPWEVEQVFRTRVYRVHFIPIAGLQGQTELGMAVFTDITEQKSTLVALQDRTQDLERSNRDLEQFANVASHELKSPLRRISGFAELLAEEYEGLLSEEADDYIHHIIDGTDSLRSVIESLLTYSRVTTDRSHLGWVDMNEVLREAHRNLLELIREREAVVTCEPLPDQVAGDRTLLRQLLENLIGNAIKFNTTDRTPQVRISARRDLLDWVFTVTDNGPGLDPALDHRVFAMFQRIHPEVEGTGIGLALCKKIVGIHRGKIWYEPAPHGGTSFIFSLSARSPEEVTIP
jgi:signal transduction histidine kinase